MSQNTKRSFCHAFAALSVALCLQSASAQAEGPETREYSRRGELSPGTEAPTLAAMVEVIERGAPEKLRATLEYGERVLCEACVPLLEAKLLGSDQPRVREIAAWWLRRQPFAAPHLLEKLRAVLSTDESPVRRARAAEALGEFMDPHALPALADALLEDDSAEVRVAAVRGLARLNSETAGAVLPDALGDEDASVRLATLAVAMTAGGFRDFTAVVPLLGDADAAVRARAASLCGEHRVGDAEPALVAMLRADESAAARKAAAWALGRIGGADGASALTDAEASETDPGVQDAVAVALRMKAR